MRILLIILVALTVSVSCWNFNNPYRQEVGLTYSQQQVQYFDQVLDHYSYLPAKFWKQRYYVNSQHFNSNHGPVILAIGGQGPCNGISDQSWTTQLAQNTGALIIALQHRYYGDSLPFRVTSFENDNLRYLSSKQALKDIAFFIEQVKKNKWYGVSDANKWVTIGGSYSGALSAWFRGKYPHLTSGAIAASAVILAVQDFVDFDQQIYLSANLSGSYCVDAIRELTEYAQQQSLGQDRLAFQGQFKAEKLTTREFMFYWSDVLVFQIQYGKRSTFCASLKGKTLEQMLQIVKPLMLRVSPTDYGAYYMSNPRYEFQNGGAARAWYYQCCTEFSYFQTFSDRHPMRSKLLTIDFYRKWCEDIYGSNTWPSVQQTNIQYGGLHMRASNLLITNGVEDPWKWASLQKSYKNITVKIANCTDCAHCRQFSTPDKHDSKVLTAIRSLELSLIKQWTK